jgi:hypothetical protein
MKSLQWMWPLVLFVFCGCAKNPYVPVSGKVTMNGLPLADVEARFQPTGGTLKKPNVGRGSNGLTDSEGHFKLYIDANHPGAVPGKHTVSITVPWSRASEARSIPPRYNTSSTLSFEVPPDGTDAANFDLKSP